MWLHDLFENLLRLQVMSQSRQTLSFPFRFKILTHKEPTFIHIISSD